MKNTKERPQIKCAVFRLQHGSLILPRNLMAELVTVEQLESSGLPGILGWLGWRERQVGRQ